jgi:hypothetical protein
MRSVEAHVPVAAGREDDSRREVMNAAGALAIEGRRFDHRSDARLARALDGAARSATAAETREPSVPRHGGSSPSVERMFALAFRRRLRLEEMPGRLWAVGPWSWEVRDSAWYGDHLHAIAVPEARIRVYDAEAPGGEHVIEVVGRGASAVSALRPVVRDLVERALDAVDVHETDTVD